MVLSCVSCCCPKRFKRNSIHLFKRKSSVAGGDDGDDDGYQLLIRSLQTSENYTVPRTPGNEKYKVRYWSNSIRTSLYRWWTFFPLNLFQQVIIPSNLYFIVMAILQLIPAISDSGGVPTFLLPISVVMSVTMLKDAYEDIKRHRSDRIENTSKCRRLELNGTFQEQRWQSLNPGDIVQVRANEQFPADLVLLICSDTFGISYVETVQLDGETNLKGKTCLPEMMEIFRTPEQLANAKIEMTYGPPNAKIYSFNGTLRLYSHSYKNQFNNQLQEEDSISMSDIGSIGETSLISLQMTASNTRRISSVTASRLEPPTNDTTFVFTRRTVSDIHTVANSGKVLGDNLFTGVPFVEFPININQFLWRGASLSNTEWVIGIVVYTGHYTRIFRNSKSRGLKYSKLLKTYNRHAIGLACSQFVLCLIAAITYALKAVSLSKKWYLYPTTDESLITATTNDLSGFLTSLGFGFGRFVLLLSYFVPITLFVQLEMVKWFQAYFLIKDKDMINPANGKEASVQTVSLMEELGSITHVFSDKTGTLTLNLMQLKSIGIGKTLYGFNNVDSFDDDLIPSNNLSHSSSSELKLGHDKNFLGEESKQEDETNGTATRPFDSFTPEQKEELRRLRKSPNDFVDFDAWEFLKTIQTASPETRAITKDFLLILALCHSVLPKKGTIIETLSSKDDIYSHQEELSDASQLPSSTIKESRSLKFDHVQEDNSSYKDEHQRSRLLPGVIQTDTSRNLASSVPLIESPIINQLRSGHYLDSPRPSYDPISMKNKSGDVSKLLSGSHTLKVSYADDTQTGCSIKDDRVQLVKWKSSKRDVLYDASSPDELALVSGALHLGVEFLQRPNLNTVQIGLTNSVVRNLILTDDLKELADKKKNLAGIPHDFHDLYPSYNDSIDWLTVISERLTHDTTTDQSSSSSSFSVNNSIIPSLLFDVLEVLEFDNVRKKMSVIIREPSGLLRLFVKGADSSMIDSASTSGNDTLQELKDQLADLSREGLRTLVFGYKGVTESQLVKFRKQLNDARRIGTEDALTEVYELFEKDLILVGCTGIDDKLQPQVPQVIDDLREAGIKLWVLTGDKVETAISIGHSCNVLTDSTYNAIISGESENEVKTQLHQYMAFIVAGQLAQDAFDQIMTHQPGRIGQTEPTTPFNDNQDDNDIQQKGCIRCLRSSWNALHCTHPLDIHDSKKRKKGQKPIPTMRWDDFVRTITFQAVHKAVVSEPQQATPIQLTTPQVNALIEEYLRSFDVSKDKQRSSEQMIRQEHTTSRESNTHLSNTGSIQSVKQSQDIMDISTITQMAASSPSKNPLQQIEYDSSQIPVKHEQFHSQTSDKESLHDMNQCIIGSQTDSSREVQRYTAVALTCTGQALNYILTNDYMRRYFFGLANLCATVIACRVTPKQKAEIIRQASRYLPGTVSLGIGDGANDVGMIITANVGVGISGKEGTQAVRAADFSIGEFRFLKNLLFHHGHENLRRNSIHVYHTVYKNVVFGLADWVFGFFSGFSAIDLYNTWIKQIFNLFFTPFPPLLLSGFDRLLPADIFLNCPWLYPIALRPDGQLYFGTRRFLIWFLYGIFSAVCIVIGPLLTIADSGTMHNGRIIFDTFSYGHTVFWLVVLASNFAVVPFFHTWFWFIAAGYTLCFSFWFTSWAVCSSGVSLCIDLESSLQMLDSSIKFHLSVLIVALIVFFPLMISWFIKTVFKPTPAMIIRERIALGVFDVVVAPKRLGGLAVVVPRRKDKEQWRGFAFSEGVTRLQLHRRLAVIPKSVITQTAALGTAAGDIFYGTTPEEDFNSLSNYPTFMLDQQLDDNLNLDLFSQNGSTIQK